MNRSEDNTCEYCKGDLPREAVGTVHFCSIECFEANEREAREQARKHFPQGTSTCLACNRPFDDR